MNSRRLGRALHNFVTKTRDERLYGILGRKEADGSRTIHNPVRRGHVMVEMDGGTLNEHVRWLGDVALRQGMRVRILVTHEGDHILEGEDYRIMEADPLAPADEHGVRPHVHSLESLSDTNFAEPYTDGYVVKWDAMEGKFILAPPSGGGGAGAEGLVAAYTPISASSLAASYVNVANPGTNDATVIAGGSAPTLSGGWVFPGTASPKVGLDTGLVPQEGWTLIVRFAGVTAGWAAGVFEGSGENFYVAPFVPASWHGYASGYDWIGEGTLTNGVMAIAGYVSYLDGAPEGDYYDPSYPWEQPITLPLFIGGVNSASGLSNALNGTITHVLIYNYTLTAAQVAAISAAIAA